MPTSGRVLFAGEDLTAADEEALTSYRRHHVGFVFQFYNLIPSLTARENVALVTEIADDPLEPEEALGLVGLGNRLDHFPSQLSGGEQQRVAIARAVAKRPSVLLCDEPTGALDFRTGILVLEVIERVNRELGTATAVITHNAPIADMADRVVTLADGRVQRRTHPRAAPRGRVSCAGDAMRVSALNRKLLRDVSRLKGQVAHHRARARGRDRELHRAPGHLRVARSRSRDAYYDRHRFAHVFAALERAPEAVAAADRGARRAWRRVQTRIVEVRVAARSRGWSRPALGRLALACRRWRARDERHLPAQRAAPEPGRDDEVVAARALRRPRTASCPDTGSRPCINGKLRKLRVVGIALSPEFVYALRPGGHRGRSRRLRRALDEPCDRSPPRSSSTARSTTSALRLQPGASEHDGARRGRPPARCRTAATAPSGARTSSRTRSSRASSGCSQSLAGMMPAMFLGVAAFLVNMVLGRARSRCSDREIATLKAVGYANGAVRAHYAGARRGRAGAGVRARDRRRLVARAPDARTSTPSVFRFPGVRFEPSVALVASAHR